VHLIKSLEISSIGPEHVDELACLHFKELHWSFNGQLGIAHIRDLYAALVKSPHFFGHIIYLKGKPIGFSTASTDVQAMRANITGAYRGKYIKVLRYFLRHPLAGLGVLESMFVVPYFFKRAGASGEWLTFITDTEAGFVAPLAALRLIDAVRDEFKARGVDVYAAQGVRDNPRAMQFYAKLGWGIAAKLPVHNIYLYRADAIDAASILAVQTSR
jgi:hypothetical protein